MSRIDTASKAATFQNKIRPGAQGGSGGGGGASAVVGYNPVKKLAERDSFHPKPTIQKKPSQKQPDVIKQLAEITKVSGIDLQALSGLGQKDLIGSLSKILVFLQRIEKMGFGDQTTQLGTMMIQENIRRLMLVKDRQADPSQLKGTA